MTTPFNTIPSLAHGAKLQSIAGTITRIGKHTSGTNSFGPWSIQIVDMQDATGTAKIQLKDRPELPGNWQGHAVQFTGEKSICIDDYQKDSSKPVERRIKITEGAQMTQVQGNFAPQPQQQAQPQQYQQPQPGPQTAQQPRQQAPQKQSHQQPQPPAYAGQTIGMAINNACALILAANDGNARFPDYLHSREFSADLHTVASDILRVSKHIENGHLAQPVRERTSIDPKSYDEHTW